MVINGIFERRPDDGSSDDNDPKLNLGYICRELNKINPNIQPPLSTRVLIIIRMEIIPSKLGVIPIVRLAAVCKLTRAFLNYYRHDPDSAIHVAIDNNTLSDGPLRDTLTVISNGIDEAIKNDTYHPSDIIPKLVGDNKLPAQTGGQIQNDQKSKIRNRKYRKTRSIKKRRLTRRRRRQSKYLK